MSQPLTPTVLSLSLSLIYSLPQTWNTACPSSSAAPSLTHLSGSNAKRISCKKHSPIDNDYASCLYSIFIFQRPFTCIVSSHLPKIPARKQREYNLHLTCEEMRLKGLRNLPKDKEPVRAEPELGPRLIALDQSFSKCGSWTNSSNFAWESVRNANFRPPKSKPLGMGPSTKIVMSPPPVRLNGETHFPGPKAAETSFFSWNHLTPRNYRGQVHM